MYGSYKNLASCILRICIMENMSSKSLKTPFNDFNLYVRLIRKKDLSFIMNSYIDYKLASCES